MAYNADISPYVHRVYLAGMLVFIYSYLLTKLKIKNSLKFNIFLAISIVLVVYTLIIGGSRMGYINILIATLIVLLYRYKFNKIYLVGIITFLAVLSFSLYEYNAKVRLEVERTTKVLADINLEAQILKHDTAKRTSLTCRFEFWYYAYEMGKSHFPLGVGTGDGILELERYIGKKETEELFGFCLGDGTGQFNPHNMYLFMFMQFGLLGILYLLWMLYVHLREAVKSQSVAFVVLIITTILTLFSLSELFTSKFFIPFYGYAIIVMYLISKESKEDKTLIPWK
jgi:O-antigen ligase